MVSKEVHGTARAVEQLAHGVLRMRDLKEAERQRVSPRIVATNVPPARRIARLPTATRITRVHATRDIC